MNQLDESLEGLPGVRPRWMGGAKVELLKRVLADYELPTTVAIAGGLMTVARLQRFAPRIELISQLALAVCIGTKRPTLKQFDTWLNRQLGAAEVARLEDPPEDVFVLNVPTRWGGFLIIPGLWEAADHSVELLLQALETAPDEISRSWSEPVRALLRLSHEVVRRAGLHRWQFEPAASQREVKLRGAPNATELARRVTFSPDDLAQLDVSADALEPFLIDDGARLGLLLEQSQETAQRQRPVLRLGDQFILTAPSAVSYAIRRFILIWAHKHGLSSSLSAAAAGVARARLLDLTRRGSRHGPQFLRLPAQLMGIKGHCDSIVLAIAKRHFIHYLLIASDMEALASMGLNVAVGLPPGLGAQIGAQVDDVRAFIEANIEFSAGHTIVVSALAGELSAMPNIPERKGWTSSGASLADINLLLQDPDSPQDRLFLLLNQKQALEQAGYVLPNHNGLLNLYQFWIQQHFHLRIPDAPHNQPNYVQIEIDYVRRYRQARRESLDEHVVTLPGGELTIVQRANPEASYRSLRDIPAYVSLDLVKDGQLAFYMPMPGGVLWVRATSPNDTAARKPVFELWQTLQFLLHRALVLDPTCAELRQGISEVVLDFTDMVTQEAAEAAGDLPTGISIESTDSSSRVLIRPEPGFLKQFSGAENEGEALFLATVLQAIERLQEREPVPQDVHRQQARLALGGPAAKVLHSLRIWNDVEMLLLSNARPVYAAPTEQIQSARQESFAWMPGLSKALNLDTDATTQALNNAVSHHVGEIQTSLRTWNRPATLAKLLEFHETLIREGQRWKTSARAVRALYGLEEGTGTAQESEQERAQLQITIRALVEAATCECSDSAGLAPDDFDVDELVGRMVNIIDLGRISDVVHFGLATNGMKIFPSGSYTLHADVLSGLAAPFMAQSFGETYAAAAGDYERWVRTEQPEHEKPETFVFESPAFLAAWQAEYGMSFDAFRQIAGALQDIAVKQGRVVVQCSAEALEETKAEGQGVTAADVQAFLSAFGLPRRETWPAQKPAAHRDVMPWRFERRLSLTLRPLVLDDARGSNFTFGIGNTRESLAYTLDSIQKASFDKDVFTSREMRSWLGGRVDELGHKFAESVAARLRALGWQAKSEVKLTQLGAPKSPNLGDLDVLAWHPDGRVLAIECKRLKASRTIAEIAQNCDRFRGNVGDLLHKHLRRKAWLEANPSGLAKLCGLNPAALRVSYPLVVNRAVPFKYLAGLQIPASDVLLDSAIDAYLAST